MVSSVEVVCEPPLLFRQLVVGRSQERPEMWRCDSVRHSGVGADRGKRVRRNPFLPLFFIFWLIRANDEEMKSRSMVIPFENGFRLSPEW